MSIRFVAQRELVKSLQAGGMDANGQKPERHISPRGGMMPCRHWPTSMKGRPTSSWRTEQGPIFLHAEPCTRHAESEEGAAHVPRARRLPHSQLPGRP